MFGNHWKRDVSSLMLLTFILQNIILKGELGEEQIIGFYESSWTHPAELDHCRNMVDHVETWSRNVVDNVSNINVKWPPLSEHGRNMFLWPCSDHGRNMFFWPCSDQGRPWSELTMVNHPRGTGDNVPWSKHSRPCLDMVDTLFWPCYFDLVLTVLWPCSELTVFYVWNMVNSWSVTALWLFYVGLVLTVFWPCSDHDHSWPCSMFGTLKSQTRKTYIKVL